MRSKTELASARIKRMLEVLNSYSFNLYNMRGKDMILNAFLSRIKEDTSIPHEIILISLRFERGATRKILYSCYV